MDWNKISYTPGLSETFIHDNQDKVNWFGICTKQVLTEDFMRNHENKIEWQTACVHQKLSESFIEDILNKKFITCQDVAYTQHLSEDFVHKHAKEMTWDILFDNKNTYLSAEFIKKHKAIINRYNKKIGESALNI